MSDWLTESAALTLTGRVADDVDTERWIGVVAAARSYVERVRSDLFVSETPTVGQDVLLGTAMMAARFYERGVTPGGISEYPEMAGMAVKYDPDIARLLGIGWSGDFVIGGANRG